MAHAADRYFQESGDAIRFFLEEEAVDADGHLTRPKALAVNKLGHAMHDLDPVFSGFSRQPRLAALAKGFFQDPLLLQSMYIFKQPGIGGEVSWHQDSTYLYTQPMSCIGFWFALEDADSSNGGMLAMPGAHRKGALAQALPSCGCRAPHYRDARSGALAGWPRSSASMRRRARWWFCTACCRITARPTALSRSRHAYTLHCIDGAAQYPADNWLRRSAQLPLRGF